MASSPPFASSPPPYTPGSSLNLNRKRPSVSTGTSGPVKRRKASNVSTATSAHPLRQTSFPPSESAIASRASSFSPGADDTGTNRSSVGLGRKRRGGRRGGADSRSQTAASVTGARQGRGSVMDGNAAEAEDGEDEDEDDDEAGAQNTVLEGGAAADEAQLQIERENLRLLIESFSSDQSDRYEMWRRVRLNKGTVRRLVNQTLSQSVPSSVVTTVSGYTKMFIGEIIERAKDVQTEWLAAAPLLPIEEPLPDRSGKSPTGIVISSGPIGKSTASKGKGSNRFKVHEQDKGPLLPDHLREALRRYKKDRDGGSTGFQGLSLTGRANTASRAGGRRMFK